MWLQCWALYCTSPLGIWCGEITWLFVQPIIIILVNYMQLHNPFTKVCENLILAHYCLTTFPLCCDSNVAWQPIRLHLLHVITGLSLRGIKQMWWHWGLCVFVWIWGNSWCDFLSSMQDMSTNHPRSCLGCVVWDGVQLPHGLVFLSGSCMEIPCETVHAACDFLCFTLFEAFF